MQRAQYLHPAPLEWCEWCSNGEDAYAGSAAAAEQGDEADEAFGGTVPRMEAPPHARAGRLGRGHRFAAYPRCSADVKRGNAWRDGERDRSSELR